MHLIIGKDVITTRNVLFYQILHALHMGTVFSSLNLSDIKPTETRSRPSNNNTKWKTQYEFLHGELVEQIAICSPNTGDFKVANSHHRQKNLSIITSPHNHLEISIQWLK